MRKTSRALVILGLLVLVGLAAVVLALGAGEQSPSGELIEVDTIMISVADPSHGRSFEVATWVPVTGGNGRLIVISHGFAGDSSSHSDTAEGLAALGYTVAAPTHPDLAGLESGDLSLDPLVLRPIHLGLTIDAMEDQAGGPFSGVTIIGHSLGGYSALRLAGATPTGDGLPEHCDANPDDEVLCSTGVLSRFESLYFNPDLDAKDERVDSIVLLAPAYGPLFSDETLSSLDVGILTVADSRDEELPGGQVDRLVMAFPQPTTSKTTAGGHFVFVRPCTSEELADSPDNCQDEDDVDREEVHAEMVTTIDQFLSL